MTHDMARSGSISDRLKSFAALGLMLVCTAAWLLIAGGEFAKRPAWTRLGEVLSLAAMTWAVYPLLCAGLLVAIWSFRSAIRAFLAGPRENRRVLIDPVHVARGKVAIPRLTDAEIMKILTELDADVHPVDWAAAAERFGAIRKGHRPGDDAAAPSSTAGSGAVAKSLSKKTPYIEIKDDLYVLQLTVTPELLDPEGELEQACSEFLQDRRPDQRLVVDGLHLDGNLMDGLCDCLFRLLKKFGAVISHALRVIVSQDETAMLGYLWRCVKRNTPDLDKIARAAIYGQLLTLCLGPAIPND